MAGSKPRMLILNGSHSDIPLIEAAKSLGFYVITTGNLPHLPGHRHGDEYCYGDFSHKEEMLALASRLGIDAVCSCANDFGIITASYLAEKLGLPGHDPYETTLTLHHKDRFRALLTQHGLNTIPAQGFSHEQEALTFAKQLNYPQLVKPIDLTGGKGITKVENEREYATAVQRAFSLSQEKRIVVEEFIQGTLHSLHTFIRDGKVIFHFSDNEFSFQNPFLVSTSAAPALGFSLVKESLISLAEQMTHILSLQDGILHGQYLMRQGKAYLLEYTRRCSGDFYTWPVQYATGVDTAYWMVKVAAGMGCADFPHTTQQHFCGRHCLMASRNGTIANVHVAPELAGNVYKAYWMWQKGQLVDNYLHQKMGILFLRYDSMDEMMDKTQRIHQLAQVELEP
ncbi:MAG: hypothetical protein G8345_01405 [Magnetococcales bacterium]|nr:hypothetical protein [Magnetococcales bacterium]NGZ25527.1 hypothetical protein [Magnetococcales bacterium]